MTQASAEYRSVSNPDLVLVDTPGFSDPNMSSDQWQLSIEKNCQQGFDAIAFILNGTHDRVADGSIWANILTDKLIPETMEPDQFFYVSTKSKMAEMIL